MPNVVSEQKKNPPKLRIAVVGIGSMGQHHLRINSTLKNIELVAVVDIDSDRAREAKWRYGCEAYTHIDDLIGKVDAVSIAVPSSLHADIGLFFLQNGIHCLIEKPLATTEADCLKLIEAAESKGLVLAVGHIEQFNPAVQELKRILSESDRVGKIHGIDVERMNGTVNRILDVDVILDLMVHDLDIVLSLISAPILSLSAEASYLSNQTKKANADKTNADYVSALLSFSNGVVANIKASKITQKKIRQMSLTTDMGYISLNYTAQEILIYKQVSPEAHNLSFQHYDCDEIIERVSIRAREPLVLELENFINAITTGVAFHVSPRQALRALKVVWKIQQHLSNQEMKPTKTPLLEPL